MVSHSSDNPQTQVSPLPERLLNALASLNEIGSTVNSLGASGPFTVEATLRLIVASAIKVISDSSAVIYSYNASQQVFNRSSRVSAGETVPPDPSDEPRPNGMGELAITRLRRVISYEEQSLEIHPIKTNAGAKAVICYPLIVAGQIVGVLYVYLHENRHFDQLELLMLDNFVNQAAMAIFHARRITSVQRDLARKVDEVASLRRAGLLISSRHGLKDTLEAILHMALEVTDSQYGSFRLVSDGGGKLTLAAIVGDPSSEQPRIDFPIDDSSIMGWVAKNHQPLLISDVQEKPWADIYYPLNKDIEMRSELAVPLIGASGRLEGVLNLESPQPEAFNDQDSHVLQAFATQAVIAIQEILLLNVLQEITEVLLSEPYQQVMQRLAEMACNLLNSSSSAVWSLDGNELVLQAAINEEFYTKRLPVEDSYIGQAILKRKLVTTNDIKHDPSISESARVYFQDNTRILAVPLFDNTTDKQVPIGAISVGSLEPEPGKFTESDWDKKVLTILAQYASLAIQNAGRQEALLTERNQRAVSETFAALGDIAVNLLHQLNNKFGIIPVRVQGIQDKSQVALQADPYLAANLAKIESEAHEAMNELKENLTLLHPISPLPIDMEESVIEAINKAHLPDSVHVQIMGLGKLPQIMAGKPSVKLIFVNLLENAANAMDNEGTIKITGAADDHWVIVSVWDNGPGIPPEIHEDIFELTYSGVNPLYGGKLGFGLWWVRMLMVRLGGKVSVESDGKNGTIFKLKFPNKHARSLQKE
ncbi:MAG: GAF domain-containing protein [Chloroflexi bacterium]|nr:GAF domain-containing protein [Chloroflexota bacterium]